MVPQKPSNVGGGKGPDFRRACQEDKEGWLAMSLQTPESIRRLQRKLYRKAKGEPGYRFYLLHDKIYRQDTLLYAYQVARANQGAPGVDGQSFEEIETKGLEEWILGLQQELRTKTYQPQPVRRVMIPKPGGGERPLGIPTLGDRVVQTVAKLVLEPALVKKVVFEGGIMVFVRSEIGT
jgi:RNA-directed DNA polymerase